MNEHILQAKEKVIMAGKQLLELGLIARTWGNISCRVSEEAFVISPSGLAYDTLTTDQIVEVKMEDLSYSGEIKPSSEKGIHADVYRLRKDIQFVIHTHQEYASAISIEGVNLNIETMEGQSILGEIVPCAPYGISSTKKLRKQVSKTLEQYPSCKAVLMKHHGVICMGESLEQCFTIAEALEKQAQEAWLRVTQLKDSDVLLTTRDYGYSKREEEMFSFNCNGKLDTYPIYSEENNLDGIPAIHQLIYQTSNVNHILHSRKYAIIKASIRSNKMYPYLDDIAQIAGIHVDVVKQPYENRIQLAKKLKHQNAIFLYGEGAFCTGVSKEDAQAVELVLKKACLAALYALKKQQVKALGKMDSVLQRLVYTMKYSKRKDLFKNK
jgi:L-ribulose-5-phosphate 4-epimerase